VKAPACDGPLSVVKLKQTSRKPAFALELPLWEIFLPQLAPARNNLDH